MPSTAFRTGRFAALLARCLALPGTAHAVPALRFLVANSIALPGSTILILTCISTSSFIVTVGNPGGGSFVTTVNAGGTPIDECAGGRGGTGAQAGNAGDLESFANAAVQQGVQLNNLAAHGRPKLGGTRTKSHTGAPPEPAPTIPSPTHMLDKSGRLPDLPFSAFLSRHTKLRDRKPTALSA